LIKAPYRPDELILFVTMSPCGTCAKLILNAGIEHVVFDKMYRDDKGLVLLRTMGVATDSIREVS
jgi:deoxycytidylate deaminase